MSDIRTDETTPTERRVKVGHLVTGLVFLGLAASWALRANGTFGDLEIAVLVPVLLVVAGVIGLGAMLVGNRRRSRELAATYDAGTWDTFGGPDSEPDSDADPDPDADPDSDSGEIQPPPPSPEPTIELEPTEKEKQ